MSLFTVPIITVSLLRQDCGTEQSVTFLNHQQAAQPSVSKQSLVSHYLSLKLLTKPGTL